MSSSRLRFALASAALAGLTAGAGAAGTGCARSAEERQLDSMRAEIDKTREERDQADPPANPTTSVGPALVVPEAYTAAPSGRPPPPVVQLGGDSAGTDEPEADPQDTAPRPSIRVLGSVRSGHSVVDEQVDDTPADDRAAPSASSSLAPEAKRAYDAAMTLVNGKRYDQALDALAAFLVKWPDHPYADNAMYWRGECYFAKADYTHAAEQFEGVIKRFPAGDKVPDALLKLGMSHDKLGHGPKARESYDRLAHQFPDSDAAHRIPGARAPATPSQGPKP